MTDPTGSWRAHAKLTWSLHVTGVRDDGYHLIDAEMVSLELHDLLTFAAPSAPTGTNPEASPITTGGPFAEGVPTDRSNLVAKALDLAGTSAHTIVEKFIPHGGGLGGGSTDAATALRWAGFGIDPAARRRAGLLGADIPFCLVGGRARVRGIGELVEPLPHIVREVTLVIPPRHVSTPAVYRAWDELAGTADSHSVEDDVRNHLEAAAILVDPALAWWRDAITQRTGTAPTLAGSGATWFLEGAHADSLTELEADGATVLETHTVDAGRATGPGT